LCDCAKKSILTVDLLDVGQIVPRSAQAKEAVTYARDNLFERGAVADKRSILPMALRRGIVKHLPRNTVRV
jgi:hypothetical protein